jgi:hypothetical protein
MNIPGSDMTIAAATEAALDYLRERYPATPDISALEPVHRENWLEAMRRASEIVVVALISDMASWTDGQGDFGAALSRAVWRYSAQEIDYLPTVPADTE